MSETRLDTRFLTLLQTCPLDNCDHSLAMHNQTDETVTGFRCCANPCVDRCGEQHVDLANEEWS
jgi:hypothetical protein